MISNNFYKDNNLVNEFLGGTAQHYPLKEPNIILESYPYQVQAGDNMYTLAKKIFGDTQEFQWVIIADLNYLRQPDDLQPGEIIQLPKIILSEQRYEKTDYAKTAAATTKI